MILFSLSFVFVLLFHSMKFYILVPLLFLGANLALTTADDIPEDEVMELLVGIASMQPEELMEMQEGLKEVYDTL